MGGRMVKAGLDLLFDRLSILVSGVALLVALGVMAAQVVARYVIGDSLVWSEELARYALVWSSMIGAAVAYRRGAHAAIAFVVDSLPGPVRVTVVRIVHALVLGFGGLVAWTGWALAARNFARHQLAPALQIEIAWVYLAIPAGGLLIAIAAIEGFVRPGRQSAGVTAL